jgi:solute carrier family 13 (sodium-dependent dicarboxylate transporter), member 2/3/5
VCSRSSAALRSRHGPVAAHIGMVLGPAAAVATYVTVPVGEGGLTAGGRGTAAVAVLMAVWWVAETLPLAVTSLVPIVLLPLTGALELSATTQAYGNPLVFLFLGGFVLALALQRWGLHRRIALLTIRLVGTRPTRLVGGFMLAAGGLSMWVSNTATTVMMLPIGVSVLGLVAVKLDVGADEPRPEVPIAELADDEAPASAEEIAAGPAPNLGTGLMLGIAYAASIGSLATLIGTPPNAFLAGFLRQSYGIELGFGRWMLFAFPLSLTFLAITWFVLTRWLYPPEIADIPGGAELIDEELAALGPLSRGERNVLVVFVLMAGSWVLRGLLQEQLAGTPLAAIDDPMIAIAGAILLFALPVDWDRGVFTMDWATARQLPWGVLLLFGGGLALAAAVADNGVDLFVGEQLAQLSALPVPVLITIVVATVILSDRADLQHRDHGGSGAGRGRDGRGHRARSDGPRDPDGAGRDLRVRTPGRHAAERHRVRVGLRHDPADGPCRARAQRGRHRADRGGVGVARAAGVRLLRRRVAGSVQTSARLDRGASGRLAVRGGPVRELEVPLVGLGRDVEPPRARAEGAEVTVILRVAVRQGELRLHRPPSLGQSSGRGQVTREVVEQTAGDADRWGGPQHRATEHHATVGGGGHACDQGGLVEQDPAVVGIQHRRVSVVGDPDHDVPGEPDRVGRESEPSGDRDVDDRQRDRQPRRVSRTRCSSELSGSW